jgi:hypothetical protein
MNRWLIVLLSLASAGCFGSLLQLNASGGMMISTAEMLRTNPVLCKVMVGTLVGGTGAIILGSTMDQHSDDGDGLMALGGIGVTVGGIGSAVCLGQYIANAGHRERYRPPALSGEDKERLRVYEESTKLGPAAP